MTLGRKIRQLGQGSGYGVWESRHSLALGRDGAENEAVAEDVMHRRLREQREQGKLEEVARALLSAASIVVPSG